MYLSTVLHTIRKGWLLILGGAVLGLLGAAAVNVTAVPEYKATTSLYVSVGGSTNSSELAQGGTAAEQKVQSFAAVATGARVLQPVIDELGLRMTSNELAEKVATQTPIDSVIIDITVTDGSPTNASAIANAVGASLADVVTGTLETPSADGTSPFRIETVQPALVPEAPATPRVVSNLVGGLALGLLAGLAAAAVRIALDTRLEGRVDIEETGGAPVLGEVPYHRDFRDRPLAVHSDPLAPRSEAFRRLRTNLRFLELGRDSKSFVVTSSLPGEGKSTVAVNMALALAEDDQRVVLVDGDLRRPRVAEMMGVEGAVGLTDVLIGRAELQDALQPWGRGNLVVLPSGQVPPNPAEMLSSTGMTAILADLEARFDVIVIDAPPLLPVADAAILGRIAGGALLVAATRRTSRKHFAQAAAALRDAGSEPLGAVITMARPSSRDPYALNYSYQSPS
ncbi:chromosome partitioning protein [Curtobacterium sp. MCJR17_055]|uniref:polysaccharide biosynthesis tyrosine autokinase n=1 Tax=unclassified Curtobacterium TaxID=257496 RepID=UPI000D971E7C|nr:MULTISPECIES: polysaccharide biosynthesis tyrosine autokinase [unclassified Curtobacterium]PYY33825.1 chromosome partitioning protein [Curtobacterium sp. MCBD17_029]PYY58705.1 chromosome partitioning protein [Curtobacterium sp. MCJR17_055]PYY59754.1 chromosome partitioning protein [Curtobacterium sp. MCPF17_015]